MRKNGMILLSVGRIPGVRRLGRGPGGEGRPKLMVELMREVGFGIPVMPQGAFHVFADASRWTDNSYKFAFELLEKAGVGVAPGVDFGQAGKRSVRFSYAWSQ